MERLFICMLSLSLSGALTGLLLLLIHPFTKRCFSRKWNYYIWLLLVARLVIPVHIAMPYGIKLPAAVQMKTGTESPEGGVPVAKQEAAEANLMNLEDIPYVTGEEESAAKEGLGAYPLSLSELFAQNEAILAAVLSIIWLLGAATALCVKVKNYICFNHCIRKNSQRIGVPAEAMLVQNLSARLGLKRVPVLSESEGILSPITVGLVRPRIILPKQRPDREKLSLVLHHELIHVKRRDLWYKWLYQVLLCIHWFNPVLYFAGRRINADCELACDEAVLAALTREGRRAYGNILIGVAEQNMKTGKRIPSITLLERKEDLKERLKGILHYKRQGGGRSFFSVCAFLIMCFLSACGSVEVRQEAMPLRASLEDTGDALEVSQERGAESREDYKKPADGHIPFWERWFSGVFDLDSESFLARQRVNDKRGDAWKVYEDEELLSGKDVGGQQSAFFYMNTGDGRISSRGFFMVGSESILITQARKETEIRLETSFELTEGKFKIVQIKPDGQVETLVETGEKTSTAITLEEGRNVIKMVAQGCKLQNLEISFSGQNTRSLEKTYYSEVKEYADQIWERIRNGKTTVKDEKERLFDTFVYMDEKQVSEFFAEMLEQGVSLSTDELCTVFIYSDADLSLDYLSKAIESGKAGPLTGEQALALLPYADAGDGSVLLMALKENLTFDMLKEGIVYLDDEERRQLLSYYIEQGNELSYSEFADIAVYLDQETIEEIDRLMESRS